MIYFIVIQLLFTFCLCDKVHPQQSKHCVMDTDVHELLMKMKCELVNMKEKLRAFEESTNVRIAQVDKSTKEEINAIKTQFAQLTPTCRQIIQNCMECSSDQQQILCSLCDPGFSVNGSTCKAKSCGMPPQPLRAEYNYTGVKYGDTATYSCQSGYDLEGNQTLTCDSTCEWTVTPCCIRNLSGVITTTQHFYHQNLNDENIGQYLQDHLDPHVGELYLYDNRLTDLSWVSDFTQLDTLKVLNVRGNRIKSFSWEDIPPLVEEIVLWDNNLVSLPRLSKHSTCVHVKTLNLQDNHLENIECDHLPHTVVTLYLSSNSMKSMCDMSHLQLTELYLYDNKLENIACDHIPHTIIKLDLSFNKFPSLCDLSHLHVRELFLHSIQLENIECDHIPDTVVTLNPSHNKLTTICDFSQFTQLSELSLYGNQLTTVSADHLPPSLQTIWLHDNFLNCVNMKKSLSVSVNC